MGLLLKILPFLTPIVEKFLPGQSNREKELEKEIELETVRRGRIPPKQLFWYLVIVAFGVVLTLSVLNAVFPGMVGEMPMKKDIMDMVRSMQEGL
jgi:hypothetical protein